MNERLGPLVVVLGIVSTSSADFIGTETETIVFEPSIATYRIYALFDSPTDQLLAVGADPDHASIAFNSNRDLLNQSDPFPPGMDNDFASFPITTWDSWVTIGADGFAGNETTYTDGFLGSDGLNAVIVGSAWTQVDDGRWFDEDPATPELAGDAGRVLIAQFSFNAEAAPVAFTLEGTAEWRPAGGRTEWSAFFVTVPAPATWLVIAFAACGTRRRTGVDRRRP